MAMATSVSCIRYNDCCIRSIQFGVSIASLRFTSLLLNENDNSKHFPWSKSWSLFVERPISSLVSAVVATIVSEEIDSSSPYNRDIAMRTSKGRCLIPVEEPEALHFSCGWSLMRKQSKGQQSVNTIAEDLVSFAQFWLDYTMTASCQSIVVREKRIDRRWNETDNWRETISYWLVAILYLNLITCCCCIISLSFRTIIDVLLVLLIAVVLS